MPALDREILAERVGTVERHLARVAQRLPERAEDLQPATDASAASNGPADLRAFLKRARDLVG